MSSTVSTSVILLMEDCMFHEVAMDIVVVPEVALKFEYMEVKPNAIPKQRPVHNTVSFVSSNANL